MRTKVMAFIMSVIMIMGCCVPAFAAEPSADDARTDTNAAPANIVEIPVVFETDDPDNPRAVGNQTDFAIGSPGYISSCGNNPTFKFWVTGGSSSTQVMLNVTTSGGVNYGPFGPVKGDGSNYLTKDFIVFLGSGTWTFTAYVSNGSANGLTCHVKQIS